MAMKNKRQRGFSMLELLIVVVIIMIVAAIATPNIMNTVANLRLRSSASGMSGVAQSTRMSAIRDNRAITLRTRQIANGPLISTQFYADVNMNNTYDPGAAGTAGEPVVQTSSNVIYPAPGAPSIATMALDFVPIDSTVTELSFNARGLPCRFVGAVCSTTPGGGAPVGFIYYFSDTRALNQSGWAAVTISPSGRVRTWVWNGQRWQ